MPVRALFLALLAFGTLLAAPDPAHAQLPAQILAQQVRPQPQDPPADPAPPEKVHELLTLMDDPAVRAWLTQRQAPSPATAAEATLTEADLMAPVMDVRSHILASIAAVPMVPDALAMVGRTLAADFAARGLGGTLLLILVFVGLGIAFERLYWHLTRHLRTQIIGMRLDSVSDRLTAVGKRLMFGLGWVLAFGLGSLGAFLLLDWPPLLRDLVGRCLLFCLIVWLTTVILRFILAPGAERFRILPMSTQSARYWYVWLTVVVAWFTAGRLSDLFLTRLGVPAPVLSLYVDFLSVVWFGLILVMIWRRPELRAEHEPDPARRAAMRARTGLVTVGLVLLWLLVPMGAARLFFTALTLMALWALLRVTRIATAHILRPPGAEQAETVPPLAAVWLERGLRVLWIVGAAVIIGRTWEVPMTAMTGDATFARLLRGALHAVVILLAADLLWHVLKTWIDRTLSEHKGDTGDTPEDAMRRARLRTLLPIARNLLFVVLSVMAVLMALSALGIEVGPLIAGAGVVGVAIGFGSQTLVKDIISGVFFLLDDAFRVGEYIESGGTRGTVESFSLRSVKLRHHRGYLHTVPFGSLAKITNYSRDWVIDKMTLGVTYDTDLDRVKRIIKQVGKDLLADPALAPHIIETLKMQGVEEYADYAIRIRLKMMTKPGEQFVIRRRAYAMIKKAFTENGIQFAFPTVQVAGGDAQAAAAQAALPVPGAQPAA